MKDTQAKAVYVIEKEKLDEIFSAYRDYDCGQEAEIISAATLRGDLPAQWIDCKERLPEVGVIVNLALQHSKQDVYAGFRANGGWYCFRIGETSKYYIPNGIEEAKITHWCELPPPPVQTLKK